MTNKTLLDIPKYCMELYRNSLREIRERNEIDFKLSFPKWKKDSLLLILEKAKPNIKRKHLRRKVLIDLKRISDRAWEEVEEVESMVKK